VTAAIISSRKHRKQLSSRKSFKSIHNTFVGPQNELHLVIFKEKAHSVRTKLHYIACAVRIANKIWLNSKLLVAVSWIRPKDVHNELLLKGRYFVNDLKRSLNSFNLIEGDKCRSNTAMEAYNTVFNHGSEGKPIENIVDFAEN